MILPFNIEHIARDIEMTWGERKARIITTDHFREIEFIQWLELHVGRLHELTPGCMLSGEGWALQTDVDPITYQHRGHRVEVRKELSESDLVDFYLRFG